MFEIGEMMEVSIFNTELGGDIKQPERCEEMLLRSLDELVPIMEKRGIRMDFQSHPLDFYESSNLTADIIRPYDSPSLKYLYSIPHTFHYDDGKGDINWDTCFSTLRAMGFGQAEDAIATFNPLGFPELAEKDGKHVLKKLTEELINKG